MKKEKKLSLCVREFLSHPIPTRNSGSAIHVPRCPPELVGMTPGRFRPRDFEMPCYPLWVHLSWLLFALPLLYTLGSACLAQSQNKLFYR